MDEVEQLIAAAKQRGYTAEQIRAKLEEAGIPMPRSFVDDVKGFGASLAQGLSLNLAGHVFPGIKEEEQEFSKEHPLIAGGTNLAGNVVGAALVPGSIAPRLAARALAGGVAGGVASAADGEGTLGERAKRGAAGAGIGALTGGFLPPAVGYGSRKVAEVFKPRLVPGRAVADATGPLLPKDAAAVMARQELLAPGTSVPASLSPDLPASTRVIGANAPVARKAQEEATERVLKIKTALNEVGEQYNVVLGDRRAPLGSVRSTIVKHGLWPGDDTAELLDIQKLRSRLRTKRELAKGMPKYELGQDIKKLSDWLEAQAPEVGGIDRDYAELVKMKKSAEEVIKHLRQSRKAYASSRAAGIEPGSPGAALPSKNTVLGNLFAPNRKILANEAYQQLLQPGQIPTSLLRARARAARPYAPGLLGAIGVGAQAQHLTGLLGD